MVSAEPSDDAATPIANSSASGRAPASESAGDCVVEPGQFAQRTKCRPRARKDHNFISVVVVDKSPLLRAGLRRVLSGSRFRVTADYSSLEDLRPNEFGKLAGIAVVGLDGDVDALLHCIRSLKEQHQELRIVLLRERLDPKQIVAAIEAGVGGYLLRDEVSPNTILKSLEMILADGVVVPPGFTKFLGATAQRLTTAPVDAPPAVELAALMPPLARQSSSELITLEIKSSVNGELARLSERERLILTHLTRGASNKQIARSLNVAEATVKAHVKSLLRKLRISNRTQAAMWAINQARLSK